ncbi:MAG: HAMP domain-containing histidine kinase [Candidatus Eremiobacteraeota bacterium]|nr:HAMP domain-containing histidine kinase [Candidatus Eremiobacteraeota bacterium]
MRRADVIDLELFANHVAGSIERGATVPLLVFRVPEFVEIAWRKGRRAARSLEQRTTAAFRAAAVRIVREDDVLGHNQGSDRFAIAMLAPARAGATAGSRQIRTSLERVAAAMSVFTGRRLEVGWWPVESRSELDAFADTLDAALERGMRDRERHALLATVGHELRTPLTSIRGYIETLLEGEELDPRTTRRFLETARREALRLGRLVEGMLEFSMLDLRAPRDAYCDASEQIRATIDAVLPLARQRRVTIRARLPREAPARIDGDACVHALLNVVENAVKHGRECGSVCIDCVREGAFVRVLIDDDGSGIAPAEYETIFQLGMRGTRASRRGNGIGLAVVRAIVERFGGDVRVSASPLGGARFALCFPSAEPMKSRKAPGPATS